jgi:hypothetical protein
MFLIYVKVKLSLSRPKRHTGQAAVQLHSLLTSTLHAGERSTALSELLYLWGKKHLVPTERKAHRATEWVWKFWAN